MIDLECPALVQVPFSDKLHSLFPNLLRSSSYVRAGLRADQLAFTAGGRLLPEAGYPQGRSADLSYMPAAHDRCVPPGHSVVVMVRREEATDFRIEPVDSHLFEGVDLVQ